MRTKQRAKRRSSRGSAAGRRRSRRTDLLASAAARGPLVLEKIPVHATADVLVVGAGSAGCCAAIAAREAGAESVVLLERYGFPGGTSTQMLDTFYGFFTPGEAPRKVVGGLPDRVIDALDAAGAVFLRPNTYGAGTGVNYNPERLKLVWDELLAAAGVRVLLHATLVGVDEDESGRLSGAVIWTKQGFRRIVARRFIDASGDADLCHLAGVPYERAGEHEPAQTLTTTFRLSNVDLGAYERAGGKKLLMQAMATAVERGTHALPRKSGSLHAMNAAGCVSTVAVRVADVDATDFEQLGEAEREGRRQAFVYERFLRECVPGFGEANIIGLSHQIGVRETRRVFGEYRLTREDCLGVARFDDRVLLCGAPIEDHRPASGGGEETAWAYVPGGAAYDVPYRTLVPRGRDEMWVAGRCFSATHDAHASCRSMAQTMAMGQAAGTAVALSLRQHCGAREVPVANLQSALRSRGAVLEMPVQRARTGRDDWRRNRE
ncbi:MAG: FAD-dependent oxidoreductase [Verrucomicrobia bacterium]|nr:FAD-dependent oxidoreductase [Verrucomicrobiota bacterium]